MRYEPLSYDGGREDVVYMKPAPKKWVIKTATTIRKAIRKVGKRISVRSSKVMAKETWKHGLKAKCRDKALKKYGTRI